MKSLPHLATLKGFCQRRIMPVPKNFYSRTDPETVFSPAVRKRLARHEWRQRSQK